MTVRALTATENQRISGKRKRDGERPRVHSAQSGRMEEISFDFETLVLLIPVGFRARLGQYLTALLAMDIGGGTINDLRGEWVDDRLEDLKDVANAYGPTVTAYEDIRQKLVTAATGFESVSEYQRLLADFTNIVTPFTTNYDEAKFAHSVVNVLKSKATSADGKAAIRTELNSFVQAMLQYP